MMITQIAMHDTRIITGIVSRFHDYPVLYEKDGGWFINDVIVLNNLYAFDQVTYEVECLLSCSHWAGLFFFLI